ncbi:MAG TPA: ATPase, T2SS/T4P/T4SS family [Pseudolysinimonas sp.]|jgi:type IV secretion system protein VirB11
MNGTKALAHHMQWCAAAFSDPRVTEVVVNRPGEFAIEAADNWTWHRDETLTFDRLDGIGKLAAGLTRQTLDVHTPRCGSILPAEAFGIDQGIGGLRIQIARPPAVLEGTYSLTIRKRATDFVPTLEWLAERGYFAHLPQDRDWVAWWRQSVLDRKTILLSAETGAGKTTFAEALAREIPHDSRIITIEKTPEWNLPHRNLVTSLYGSSGDGKDADRAATQCVEDALRQRPDRILVGELRSPGEAWAYIRAMLAGHPGGITTIHAESPSLAIEALATMLRQDVAGMTMQDADLRALLKRTIHIVAQCAKRPYRLVTVEELT